MALLKVICWALIFIIRIRFPPGKSLATIWMYFKLYHSGPIPDFIGSYVLELRMNCELRAVCGLTLTHALSTQ